MSTRERLWLARPAFFTDFYASASSSPGPCTAPDNVDSYMLVIPAVCFDDKPARFPTGSRDPLRSAASFAHTAA